LDSAGLKRSSCPEMESSLCERMTKAWKETKKLFVQYTGPARSPTLATQVG
jgi:hypothetical protein